MADLNFFQRLNEATKTYDTDPQNTHIPYGPYYTGRRPKPAATAAAPAPAPEGPTTASVPVMDPMGGATGLREDVTTRPMSYGDQMSNVGDFLGRAAVKAAKTLTFHSDASKPMYPEVSPPKPAVPTPMPGDETAAESARLLRNNSALASGTSPIGSPASTGIEEPVQNIQVSRQPNGVMSFSGKDVTGTNLRYSDGRGSNPIGIVPGMDKAVIDKALTNPDGSRWSEADNARMAANLRDGADPYAGTSRAPAPDKNGELRKLALSMPGTPGRRAAAALLQQQMANDTSMATAKMQQDASMYGHELSAANNRSRLQYDMQKDARDYGLRADEHMMKKREEADKSFTSELQAMFTTKDGDGKTVVDHETVGAHKAAITAHIGNLIAAAEKRGDTATAKELRDQGPAALGKDNLQKIIAQLEVKRRSQGAHSSWNTFGGSHVDSADPSAYDIVGTKRGILQDQYVTRNGSTVPTRKLDYSSGGSAWVPSDMTDTPTQRFEIVKQKLRGE